MGYTNTTKHTVRGPKESLDKVRELILSAPIEGDNGYYDGESLLEKITHEGYKCCSPSAVIFDVSQIDGFLLFSIESREFSNFATELTEKFPDISVEWETFDEMTFYWECSREQATSYGTEYGDIFRT